MRGVHPVSACADRLKKTQSLQEDCHVSPNVTRRVTRLPENDNNETTGSLTSRITATPTIIRSVCLRDVKGAFEDVDVRT